MTFAQIPFWLDDITTEVAVWLAGNSHIGISQVIMEINAAEEFPTQSFLHAEIHVRLHLKCPLL
jgi:hypothetical protein